MYEGEFLNPFILLFSGTSFIVVSNKKYKPFLYIGIAPVRYSVFTKFIHDYKQQLIKDIPAFGS